MKRFRAALLKIAKPEISTVCELGGFGALTAAAGVSFGEGAALAVGGVSLLFIGYGTSK